VTDTYLQGNAEPQDIEQGILTQDARVYHPAHASQDGWFRKDHAPAGACLDHAHHLQTAQRLAQHAAGHSQGGGQLHLVGYMISGLKLFFPEIVQ